IQDCLPSQISPPTEKITDPDQITQKLCPLGITWGEWPFHQSGKTLSPELCHQASVDPSVHGEIIAFFQEPLQRVKAEKGYLTEDIVSLSPDTPDLEKILAMFDQEHHHTDDEVRVILDGEGIFGIVPNSGSPFEIHMTSGDFIVVPAMTRHWFKLTSLKRVVALRIFTSKAGWTAIYEKPDMRSMK
ncbi:MAG: cupin domain-containing protein, partial [Cyanobacteria bacterium]|nr:cupin domain-containing protein [Cyanobacteriota bacterium]